MMYSHLVQNNILRYCKRLNILIPYYVDIAPIYISKSYKNYSIGISICLLISKLSHLHSEIVLNHCKDNFAYRLLLLINEYYTNDILITTLVIS